MVPDQSSTIQKTPLETDTLRALGLNPTHALQHPGFYYYMAARCTEKRRENFLALEAEVSLLFSLLQNFSNAPRQGHPSRIQDLPRFREREKGRASSDHPRGRASANHLRSRTHSYIPQLYTRSYELFKKYAPSAGDNQQQSQGRLTLWIAYRIAQTYYESGKFDMAVK